MTEAPPLHGLHHLTAVTADAPGNVAFYTRTLGLRLVKKTVNQDDVSAYHLFYGDGLANPGSDITFFDWPVGRQRRGAHSVSETALRVASPAAIDYWAARFRELGVAARAPEEVAGRLTLAFEDPEGQRLALVVDGGQGDGAPWDRSPVPPEHQIRGLGPITLCVPRLAPTEAMLIHGLAMRPRLDVERGGAPTRVYEMNGGGAHAELHVRVEPNLPQARQGAGGVHHLALRVHDVAGLQAWRERLEGLGVPTSGEVERYYFRSLYFREPNGVLFEIATDVPGFTADEPLETLGESLSLPPFLEPRRTEIERGLKPV